jgi:hypothetical protein
MASLELSLFTGDHTLESSESESESQNSPHVQDKPKRDKTFKTWMFNDTIRADIAAGSGSLFMVRVPTFFQKGFYKKSRGAIHGHPPTKLVQCSESIIHAVLKIRKWPESARAFRHCHHK